MTVREQAYLLVSEALESSGVADFPSLTHNIVSTLAQADLLAGSPTAQDVRWRLSDLRASIAREQAIGRNTGVLHAAIRAEKLLATMVDF